MRWDPIDEDEIFQLQKIAKQIKTTYYCLDDVVWYKRPNSIRELVNKIYILYGEMTRQIIRKREEIERDQKNDDEQT